MPTYRQAGKTEIRLMERLLKKSYPRLVEAEVTIGILLADGGLKLHGWPAAATIRIVPQKQRAAGLPDAEITLNAETWFDLDEARQAAVMDHELFHLDVVMEMTDSGPRPKLDDCCRPKLRLCQHDWQMGGFDEIVRRHKEAAPESDFYRDLNQRFTQMLFPWG